ncbi:MAG: hypothetical protein COA99_18265 [Moraxellaceae bacterium]|nr:MAG: hypothetical protein COA99_18265 [Moraxellaceae bacterium]
MSFIKKLSIAALSSLFISLCLTIVPGSWSLLARILETTNDISIVGYSSMTYLSIMACSLFFSWLVLKSAVKSISAEMDNWFNEK